MALRHEVIISGRFGRKVPPSSARVNKCRKSTTAAGVMLDSRIVQLSHFGRKGFECSVAVACVYALSLPDRVQVIAFLN
jgi:hypothetical protein